MYKHFSIFKVALLDIRNEWSWYLLLMIVNPMAILLFLHFVLGDAIDFVSYITGTIVMTFGTGVFLSLGQIFALYKVTNALDYYLSFPLSKLEIILSLVFRNIVLSLPSIVVILGIGTFLFEVDVYLGLPFFIALLLISLSLAALGVMVGISSKNMQVASIITQILVPIFTYIAPVFIPQTALPIPLLYISYFIPTTYAANALRTAMKTNSFSIDFVILTFFVFISLIIVSRKLDWRNE